MIRRRLRFIRVSQPPSECTAHAALIIGLFHVISPDALITTHTGFADVLRPPPPACYAAAAAFDTPALSPGFSASPPAALIDAAAL